jgi:hypothetical protein
MAAIIRHDLPLGDKLSRPWGVCRIGETIMKKLVAVVAVLAAATSVAVAKDLKQDNKAAAPVATATQMTDSEMDKVTAGAGGAVAGTPGPNLSVTLPPQLPSQSRAVGASGGAQSGAAANLSGF